MSAVMKLVPAPINPPPRGIQWIDLATAASRSQWHVGHIARLCFVKWAPARLAEQRTPPEGGKPRWYVREDADPKFARIRSRHALDYDLKSLTGAQRRQVLDKIELLERWEEAKAEAIRTGRSYDQATADFISRWETANRPLSRSMLYAWRGEWTRLGVEGLKDGRWRDKENDESSAATPFLNEVKRRYLHANQRSVRLCYEMACEVADKEGWSVPSYRTAARFIRSLPLPTVLLHRKGEEAYNNACAPHAVRDYTTIDSNSIWCVDHHRLDVMVNVDGKFVRPWLTAFEDVRSRFIVGWRMYVGDPNSTTILQAFRSGVLAHGLPECVLQDNGKDMDARKFHGETKVERRDRVRRREAEKACEGIYPQLKVDVTRSIPWRPQGKPIERMFGTICARFSKLHESYCGNTPENRPYDLDKKLAAGKAPTLDQLRELFDAWLEGNYHAKEHSGQGMEGYGDSPAKVYAQCLKRKRTAQADLLELLTLELTPPLKVGRNGVTWKGKTYGQSELATYQTRMVQLRIDDTDLSRVQVYHADGGDEGADASAAAKAGRFICVAKANRLTPFKMNAEEAREATKTVRRRLKVWKEAQEARPFLHNSVEDEVFRRRDAERRKAENEPKPPGPNLVPVDHPAIKDLPRIQQEMGKIAVGAESMTPRDEPFRSLGKFFYERKSEEADDAADDSLAQGTSLVEIYRAKLAQDAEPVEDGFEALKRTFGRKAEPEPQHDDGGCT